MPDELEEAIFGGNTTCVFSQSSVGAFSDTTLQTLERRVGDKKIILRKDWFSKTVEDWDGIPIIFQREGVHPMDFEGVTHNPAETAKKIGGYHVGEVKAPHIEIGGHPRLKGTLDIKDKYAEISELYDKGILGISSAFSARNDGNEIISAPRPNHILLFEEVVDRVQPGDPGALVHTETMTEEEHPIKKARLPFADWVRSLVKTEIKESTSAAAPPPAETPAPVSNTKETETMAETPAPAAPVKEANAETSELEATIAQRDAEIAELKKELAALKGGASEEVNTLRAEVAKYKEQEAEHKFTAFLESVPVGMKATPEQVADLKMKFTSDPTSLLTQVINAYKDDGATRKVGDQFVHTEAPQMSGVGDLSKPQRE